MKINAGHMVARFLLAMRYHGNVLVIENLIGIILGGKLSHAQQTNPVDLTQPAWTCVHLRGRAWGLIQLVMDESVE